MEKRIVFSVTLVFMILLSATLFAQDLSNNTISHRKTSAIDPNELFKETLKKAEMGDAGAQLNLGKMYNAGEGVKQDYKEAYRWFNKASEQGCAEAQNALGMMYMVGTGVRQDSKESLAYYTKAAEHGYSPAQSMLGMYAYYAKDYQQSLKWYTLAAEKGDVSAQFSLAEMYYDGEGVSINYKEAIRWYVKAAEQGNAMSQLQLGRLYYNGQNVEQNYIEAAKWFHKYLECVKAEIQQFQRLVKESDQGQAIRNNTNDTGVKGLDFAKMLKIELIQVAEVQFYLGLMYAQGQGMPQDYEQALTWFNKAAEQIPGAQYNLGLMYDDGRGVPQDYKEAAKWYVKAAERGLAEAQFRLGLMYDEGQGVLQDHKEAVRWYAKAAEQGEASAQCNLGNKYWHGQGVPEDYIEAYKWLNISAAQGVELAVQKRNILREKMSPDQIAEAQRLCKEFKPKVQGQTVKDAQNSEKAKIKGNGTGFFITADGYLLTALHVVKEAASVQVLTGKGLGPAKVVRVDAANDIALLKVDEVQTDALAVRSSRDIKAGQEIFTLGFPNIQIQGTEAKYTQGNINSLSGIGDDPRLFQISTAVQPGNSGGPLLDGDGQVVGLVVAKLDEIAMAKETGSLPQNVNYALKSSFVLSFLESLPELNGKLLEPKKTGLTRTQVVEKTSKAVVMILCY
jgi:hypothetical protein